MRIFQQTSGTGPNSDYVQELMSQARQTPTFQFNHLTAVRPGQLAPYRHSCSYVAGRLICQGYSKADQKLNPRGESIPGLRQGLFIYDQPSGHKSSIVTRGTTVNARSGRPARSHSPRPSPTRQDISLTPRARLASAVTQGRKGATSLPYG